MVITSINSRNKQHNAISLVFVLFICAMLAACGGKNTTKPVAKSTPVTSSSKAKPGSGGYYLDDGPGDNPPTNIDSIPDAVPKSEAPLPRANKPYTALGQRYVPMTAYTPYKKQGVASWYGKRYHGKKTSSGEIYDMYGMSAAHPTLPLPSYARVTNPVNGRSVIVRINDRGPFKHDRLIDLSYAAAYRLRLSGQGSGWVEVEAINTGPQAVQVGQNLAKNDTEQAVNSGATDSSSKTAVNPSQSEVQLNPVTPVNIPASSIESSKPTDATAVTGMQYYVQAGAFKSEQNGNMLQKKIQTLELAENVGVANVYNNGLYRVRLGPYASKTEADASAAQIRKRLNISAIVQLQ
jgi:rare lipoprotein A